MSNIALRFGGVAIATCFSIIMIGAGHGAGPVGLLLVLGRAPEWIAPQIFGCVAVILEVIAFWDGERKRWRLLAGLALCAFVISAALFILNSETLHYLREFYSFMIPFAVAAVFRAAQIAVGKKEPIQSSTAQRP